MDYGKVFNLQLDGVFNYSFRLSLDNSNPDKQAVEEILKERYDIHKKTVSFIIKREISRTLKRFK